jgi:hypothetical protein
VTNPVSLKPVSASNIPFQFRHIKARLAFVNARLTLATLSLEHGDSPFGWFDPDDTSPTLTKDQLDFRITIDTDTG